MRQRVELARLRISGGRNQRREDLSLRGITAGGIGAGKFSKEFYQLGLRLGVLFSSTNNRFKYIVEENKGYFNHLLKP
jgi:hypothetical protein